MLLISFLFSFAFSSLLFTAICKASTDSHFAFLHFFSMGMVLIPVSCTISWTSFLCQSGRHLFTLRCLGTSGSHLNQFEGWFSTSLIDNLLAAYTVFCVFFLKYQFYILYGLISLVWFFPLDKTNFIHLLPKLFLTFILKRLHQLSLSEWNEC